MYSNGKEAVISDEASMDSNASVSMDSNASVTNLERSDDLAMLYLLATVAEAVSVGKLQTFSAAATVSQDAASKCKSQAAELPAVTKTTQDDDGGCDEGRLFRMKCKFCGRGFSRMENLRWHMKKHIKNIAAQESLAPVLSPSLLPADQAVARQAEKRSIPAVPVPSGLWCGKCKKSFQRAPTYRVHMGFHVRRRPVLSFPMPCRKCSAMCLGKLDYLVHKDLHRMEKILYRRRRLVSKLE